MPRQKPQHLPTAEANFERCSMNMVNFERCSMNIEYFELAKMAEKKGDLNLSKGTTLKRKADEKKTEISVLESDISALVSKKPKLSEQ